MPAITVVHEPRLPDEADIDRLSELFATANAALEHVNFRLAAYKRPFFEEPDELPAVRPTFEDIGRLAVFIEHRGLDRWTLDQQILKLEEAASVLLELREGPTVEKVAGDLGEEGGS